MEKEMKVDPKGQSALSCEEMTNITGGSITETVVKIVWSVTEYFFRVGVSEGKRMKAQL
jgi:hypothetical protein